MVDKFKATFKLRESNQIIAKKLVITVKDIIKRRLILNSVSMAEEVGDLITQTLKTSTTYAALISAPLRGEIGFEEGTEKARVDAVIRALSESVRIQFPAAPSTTKGVKNLVRIGLVPKNLSFLYNMDESVIYTDKDQILPWLKWLLERGSEIIIDDYEPIFLLGAGRSRMAVMIDKGNTTGGFWKIPIEYQGVKGNNWITRELTSTVFRNKLKRIIVSNINRG